MPILMLGGIYLAYEGAEKIYEYFYPYKHEKGELKELSKEEILEVEKSKIKSAILTDFILSIEIIIIALGSVMEQTLVIQIIAVTFVAIAATIGVYGVVALLVRMDDFGFVLIEKGEEKSSSTLKLIGEVLVQSLPKVIKFLTFVGTIAMLLVAGGIFVHNLHALHDILHFLPSILPDLLSGAIVGAIALVLEKTVSKLRGSHS